MALTYPPIFINRYLAEKVPAALPDYFSSVFRFFPTMPTNIDELTETFPESAGDVFAVYDRMFRMRRKAFPHIKCEQVLYYFYKVAGDITGLVHTTQVVQDILDRGDESAEDINTWIASLPKDQNGNVLFDGDAYVPVKFHDIKIYQLEETRDIVDFGTARTYAGNKIIIDYDYHSKGYSSGNSTYNGTQIN